MGTIYHHSLWHRVIVDTYGYQPLYHFLLDHRSSLQAAVSSAFVRSYLTGSRIVSYPFSDTCDPLVTNPSELNQLIEAVRQSKDELGACYLEFRVAKTDTLFHDSLSQPEYSTYSLSIDRDPELLLRSFHKSCIQRSIQKARRRDLRIVTGDSEEHLKAFCRLHVLTRQRLGVPVQPFRFFKNLWALLTPKQMLTLLLAKYRDRYVAGIILLWFKDTAYYKFGASDYKFEHLRANQLLMWEAIRKAQEKGCKNFDFGRTSSSNIGLALYKSRWGTKKIPIYYLREPDNHRSEVLNETSRKHAILRKLISRMPGPMVRMGGALFYKHFG